MASQLLRLPGVIERTGFSRSQIYALIQRNAFPAPIKLGSRASAWVADEIDSWIRSRIAESRSTGSGVAM